MQRRALVGEATMARLMQPLHSAYGALVGRMSGPVIMTGPADKRAVALTFDDGPSPAYTRVVLDVLDRHRVPATFFLLGEQVRRHPQIARDIVDAGHAIGAHTYSHPVRIRHQPLHFAREIVRTHWLIARATGTPPRMFRPPRGIYDPLLFAELWWLMGYVTVMWSVAAKDWRGDRAEAIAARVLTNVKPGAIICLHDGCGDAQALSTDRTPTVGALSSIIDNLTCEAYRFVTVGELIGPARKKGHCG